MINLTHESQSYSIVSAYAPNNESDRMNFFKRLQTWINQNSINEHGTILCGDLKSTLSKIDRNTNIIDRTSKPLSNL